MQVSYTGALVARLQKSGEFLVTIEALLLLFYVVGHYQGFTDGTQYQLLLALRMSAGIASIVALFGGAIALLRAARAGKWRLVLPLVWLSITLLVSLPAFAVSTFLLAFIAPAS